MSDDQDKLIVLAEAYADAVEARATAQEQGGPGQWSAADSQVAVARQAVAMEIGALRKRVAELEAGPGWAEFRRVKQLADAAAKANEALESIGEQAAQRIAELEAACRCGARALRLHDEASPTAAELEAAAENRSSVYRAGNSLGTAPAGGPAVPRK